ncbi:MAG: long-chain N-acyl amino acid synthase [Planctomycetota bacterium]
MSNASVVSSCSLIPQSGLKRTSRLSVGLEYGIATEREELEAAFALIYNSYRRAGLMEENEQGIRVTPFHLLTTTEVFITKYQGEVVSTVSLIGDGDLGLPLESIYPDDVKVMREGGLKMAEIGCLADRRNSPVRFVETFSTMGRMLAQVAKARGYDGLVAATHPKHARLYSRILPFEQVGEETECPYANGNPAVMLALVFDQYRGTSLYDRFFGAMSNPTETDYKPWESNARQFFEAFVRSEAR